MNAAFLSFQITYDYLVVALGIQLRYDLVSVKCTDRRCKVWVHTGTELLFSDDIESNHTAGLAAETIRVPPLKYILFQIKGAEDALKLDPAVCSNYSPKHVLKTHPAIQSVTVSNNSCFSLKIGLLLSVFSGFVTFVLKRLFCGLFLRCTACLSVLPGW